MYDTKLLANRIEKNLQDRVAGLSSRQSMSSFYKKKCLRYLLKKQDWLHYVDPDFSWITGLYALGLLSSGSDEAIRCLKRYYKRILLVKKMGMPVFETPDQLLHAEVMLQLYEKYGARQFLPGIHEAARFLENFAEKNDGHIIYWPPDPEVYVDTLGMITEFCYRYDAVFHVDKLSAIADDQLKFMEQKGITSGQVFPCHAIELRSLQRKGASSWGRGIGWYLSGLTSYVIHTGRDGDRLYQKMCALFRTQDENGFLYDDIEERSHIDTSTTVMALVCLQEIFRNNLWKEEQREQFRKPFELGIQAICHSVTEEGEVINCSGECRNSGEYSTEFGNYFAQGYTLKLLTGL